MKWKKRRRKRLQKLSPWELEYLNMETEYSIICLTYQRMQRRIREERRFKQMDRERAKNIRSYVS